MTNEGWEALQKAITTARKQHESRDSTGAQDVINGALIRAVELLASQVPVETEGARAARIVNDAMETGVDPAKALISAGFPLHTRAVEGATLRKELAEARAKIDDLESRTPANEVHDSERAQYEATIKQKDERIVALANELAAQRVGHNWEAHLSNGEHEAEKARMEATIEQQRKRIEELELLTRSRALP